MYNILKMQRSGFKSVYVYIQKQIVSVKPTWLATGGGCRGSLQNIYFNIKTQSKNKKNMYIFNTNYTSSESNISYIYAFAVNE